MALLGQFRRDTLENWSTINPMLADGEFIIVRDNTNTYTIGYKTGNGYSRFNDLGYNSNVTFLNELGDNEQAGISQKFTGQIINDYNISNLHTNEIAADPAFGTNKFTLSQAIAVIPASVLKQGLAITFISSETNEWKRYQNVGTPFTTLRNWEDLASNVNVIQPPGDLDANDYLYNIYYAPITGKVTYEPSRLTTDFIQVDNGQIIYYTIYGYTSSIAIAAFDANQNIILNKCVITSSLTGETGRYIVNSDIRFLRFTRLNDATGLKQSVSFYKPDYFPNIEESTKGIRQFSESDFIVEGMYINPVTGKDVANASWNATDFIPVVEGELIFNKNLYGTTGGAVIAFYDGVKVPVELIRGNTAYDANFVTVPEGALYVRFSMATSMPVTIKIINGTNRTQMLSEDKGEIIVNGFDKFYVTGTWSRSGKDLTVTGGGFTQARYDTPTFEDEFVMSCRVRSTVATGGGFETGIGKTSPTAGYVDRWIMMCKNSTGSYLKSYYRPNGSYAEHTEVRQKLATELVLNKWYVLQLIKTTDEKSAITGRLYDEETGELLASFRTTAAPYAWGYPVAINRTGQAQFSGFVMSYPKKSYPLVAVYGDSFIEGNSMEATKNLRYSALLQSVLGKYQCLLFGHGGATSLSDDSRTLLQIEKVNSAYAIIAYGDNDVDFNTWYKYVAYMIQMCEVTNTLPVFVTVCPRVSQSAAYVAKMQAINNWIRTSGYPYIDANEACTSDGLTWKTGYVLDDGQHPSVLGHQAIFNKIKSDCGFLVENAEAYDTGKGKVTIFNLEAKNSSSESVERLLSITGFLANGIDNHKIVDDKIYTLLKLNPGTYEKAGVSIPTVPTIVIHDDDTIDNQIPESGVRGADETTRPTTTTQGGYASILWPLIKAINVKYGSTINATDNKIICGLAAEGQRTGLTKLYGQNDEFTGSLNSNGKIVKKLVEHEGWDVMCHSMTARYIEQNYWVEGLNSDFAIDVRVNGVWNGDLHWNTTTCYDTVTKKNYQIKQDKTGWTELPKAYIKPYCAVSREANSTLLINPTYSVKYQVETWFNRADIAGLPYLKKVGVNWGNSHSIWHMRESLKYADRFFARSTESNIVPCDTNLHRFGYAPSAARNGVTNNTESYNVYTEVEYARMTNAIDRCIATNGLLVLFSHVNAPECSNFYYSYFTYPTERTDDRLNYRDDNYNPEWTVPLQYDELMSMDENNYWEVPPARLGIANWGEWYPCPGTTMALLYDSIRYAISKGVRFATSTEANESFGNLVSIGIRNDQATFWDADPRLGDIEEENRSYCTIGADGSINYKS